MKLSLRQPAARFGPSARRGGYVLFAVLLVTVVLSLTAYRFSDSMTTENAVAVRSADQVQARLAAVSGLHYAAGILASRDHMADLGGDPSDSADLFSGQVVGSSGKWKFSLVNVSESKEGGTGDARYPFRFGISDESGKININALIASDTTGNLLYTALSTLPVPADYPYTAAQIADSIVDWVDPDSTTRTNGAEDDYYAGMGTPYRCKNGPINSLDELLLVQGVTPQLLYGSDRNRNGKQDANEQDGQEFSRGWSEYLTCYGRDINVDTDGQPRLFLNGKVDSATGLPDMKTVSEGLTALVGQELSDYMMYYAFVGSGKAVAPLTNDQVAASPADLRDLVQKAVEAGQKPARQLTSVLDVLNTQLTLPRPPPPPGPPGRVSPQPVVVCPINDPTVLKQKLAILLDKCTCEEAWEIAPKININTAPLTVLSALPGVTAEDVTNIVNARADQDLSNPEVTTGAWLMTQAQMRPDIFKILAPLISGRSWTYRVHSVGYAAPVEGQVSNRGAVSRMEAVIDVGTRTTDGSFAGLPRFLYFRDLTDLGRGFTDLP